MNERIPGRENLWERENANDIKKIEKIKQNIALAENERSKETFSVNVFGSGLVILFIGVFMLIFQVGTYTVAWRMFFLGIILFLLSMVFTNKKVSNPNKYISDERAVIERIRACQAEHKSQLDEAIASIRRTISDHEAEIVEVQGKIADCRRYLDLGKDKISEYWFSKKCEAFGVNKPFDSQIQEYREAILNIFEES